ncbi:MAG TPA: long-chain fatty acid--CoA ligase [Syntrophomonas sp.]|nr:long-chain fatty acid--CoA ligase [Syntrophomonas sp.]HRW12451.1 long-chain fatty acid--CoA ligase [Syntrophomonas sp.]
MTERRWQQWYDPGVPTTCYYPLTTMKDEFIKWVRANPDKPYIYCNDLTYSYQETNHIAKKLANVLLELGVKKGDRVSLVLPNIPEFIFSAHAVMKTGAIIVPVNPLYTVPEMVYNFSDSGSETVIVYGPVAPRILEVMRSGQTQLKKMIVMQVPGKEVALEAAPDILDYASVIEAASDLEPEIHLDNKDTVILIYTGGTTGVPKGCCLTNSNFVAFYTVFIEWARAMFPPQELRTLCTVPLYHIYGFNMQINANLASGGTMILVPEVTPDNVLDAIDRFLPTYWPAVPALIQMLNMHPRLPQSKASSIRFLLSGSAPLPVEAMKKFEELTGSTIIEGFGGSETTNGVMVNPKGKRKPGSVGIPFPDMDVRIVDLKNGTEEVPIGEPGELHLKGPLIIEKYWNKPEETANAIKDGWFNTGDIATMDEDGYITIVGRTKDMIISSGFNVYPRDIDELLYTHPKVLDAGAIGVPDPIRGESVKVFVVLKPGETMTEEEVIEFCRQSLAAYKVPRYVEFLEDIPRTNMKKVDRKALREMEATRQK